MKTKPILKWRYTSAILFVNIGLALVLTARAQYAPPIVFQEIAGVGGKPLGMIRNITQDPSGYMWFSGEEKRCLYRYDGKQMTAFRQDLTNPNSLGGNIISHVYADNRGLIWVAPGQGLDRFDPVTNTFTHYKHDEANEKSLISDGVLDIMRDSKGNLWVGTDQGLDRFDEVTGEFIHYQHDPNNPRSLSCNIVSRIYEDSHGVIWIATSGFPWVWPDPNMGGLNRMEPDGGFKRYMHDPKDPTSLISNKVLSVFEDSRGVFWVGTGGDGLHTMDRETGRFTRHTYDPKYPEKLSRPELPANKSDRVHEVVTFITEDHKGAIWFGTLWGGLSRYDPVTQKVSRYKNTKDNGYFEGITWNAFVSRDGVLWIADQPKLYAVDLSRKVVEQIKVGVHPGQNTHITRFFEDDDGSLWVGSGEGVLHLDNSGKLIKSFPIKFSETENVIVTELWREGPDMLWLGTKKGVYKMNIRTEQYTKIDFGFDTGIVIHIEDDKNGFKWITTTEAGLLKFDGKTVVKRYRANKDDPTSLSDEFLIRIEEDGDFLWIASGIGVNRLDPKTDKFKHYLTDTKVTYVLKDSSGQLWAGTSAGLFRYDRASDSFKAAGYNSVIATHPIYAMVEDDHSNLWMTSYGHIVRIDSSRQVVTQIGAPNGLVGNITPGAIYLTRNGELLAGSGEGYYHLNIQDPAFVEKPPQLVITKFDVNNVSIANQRSGSEISEEMESVSLDHNENNFSISFAMIDYRDPPGNEFYSKLEGFDNEWREADDNTTRFFSVPPGNYTYRLRAHVSSGATSEKAIAITINPPWWKTSWAYVGYSLIVFGLLFGARRVIVHQERLKSNLLLEHLELEKAKEVDKVKTTFFANISHEFRTPLTLIKGPVEELMEKYSNDPNTMRKLKLVRRNSDLLLKLINQLLDLARLEAGSLKLEKSEGDIYAFLRAIVNSFESFATQKGVSLSAEVPVVSKSAVFDKGKFETILINLINNAIKFTPAGGSVHVKALADHNSVSVSVKDSGIGISHKDQEKVFERFHQVSEAHKEVGTGIGLSLVKEFVAFMQGTIEVNSELGQGAEFRVTLPLEMSSLQSAEHSGAPEMVWMTATNSVQNTYKDLLDVELENGNGHMKSTILVVEDNSDLRSFIIDSLGKEFSFLEAENGAVGLDQALQAIPNLIISDVMMPEMDGITMAQKIKKDIRTSHIPLIMLTAKTTEESKLQGLESGADDYLTKPFNKNELLLKIRNAINRQIKLREKLRAELLSHAPAVEVLSEDEKFLNKVKEQILERLSDEQLGVESLGSDIGLSRSQLFRKINALTGMSVNELIRKLRLQRADQLISQNWGPVAQVAYEVGFSNPSYFSKCFKEEFGILPSERYEKKGV